MPRQPKLLQEIDLRLGALKRDAEAVFGFPGGIQYLLEHGLHRDMCLRDLSILESRVREEWVRAGLSSDPR